MWAAKYCSILFSSTWNKLFILAHFLLCTNLGSPEINGNLFFLMNMYIHICIIDACAMIVLSLQLNWLRTVSLHDASCKHYTYNIIRLASKFLNCTHSLQNIAQKINKYATKHEINTMKVSSDNFTNLPVTFLFENYIEITKKFAMFFNILLNFLLWLCGSQVAWHKS